jgi:hypothetical protein
MAEAFCGGECNFGPLKAKRSLAAPYDMLTDSFLEMLYLGAIKIWLKSVHTA